MDFKSSPAAEDEESSRSAVPSSFLLLVTEATTIRGLTTTTTTTRKGVPLWGSFADGKKKLLRLCLSADADLVTIETYRKRLGIPNPT